MNLDENCLMVSCKIGANGGTAPGSVPRSAPLRSRRLRPRPSRPLKEAQVAKRAQ